MLKMKKEFCGKCEGQGHEYENDAVKDCGQCNGNGYIRKKVGEDEIVFVNAYSVTRHYGGPEEGGWWYNALECIEIFPVKNKASQLMKEELEKAHEGRKWGNIYSVLGGEDIEVYIESTPKESETRERPRYE